MCNLENSFDLAYTCNTSILHQVTTQSSFCSLLWEFHGLTSFNNKSPISLPLSLTPSEVEMFEDAQLTNISLAGGCVPLLEHFPEQGRRALAFPLPLPSSWVSSTEISVVELAIGPRIYTAWAAAPATYRMETPGV